MEQSLTSGVEVAPNSRAQIRSLTDSLASRGNRRVRLTSAVSAMLAVALPVADRMIWGRSSLNPLLVLATLFLLGAAVSGVSGLQRRWPRPLGKHGVSASIQSLMFELGLLLTLTWSVDLIIKAFSEK